MTTVASAVREQTHAPAASHSRDIRIALLGLGQVGSAIADLARRSTDPSHQFTIASALVRDGHRIRRIDTSAIPLTIDPATALSARADVVVEVLGGLEPARTLVLAALERGTPVVTANKSLLAAHGDELFEAARHAGAPLLYEASVLAGVPFLGTFSRRPRAKEVTALAGIVNGTSNFILSRMAADRVPFDAALADAQQAGYAEPDSSKDIQGDDAVEKLCVLLRHFGGVSVAPRDIEKTGIQHLELADLDQAAAFGGTLRPVVVAEWDQRRLTAYAGPAFVPSTNPLARVDGVQNAVSLRTRWTGDLFFSGPGAGPTVTAATVLDDIVEGRCGGHATAPVAERRSSQCATPETGWFIRLTSRDLADEQQAPGLLGRLGIRVRRTSPFVAHHEGHRQWVLTAPCGRAHLTAALEVLSTRAECDSSFVRAID